MRRNQRERAGCAEMVHHRHTQRSALFRIGGGAQLVQQHEGIRRHVQNHFPNARDMRRKCAQAFLDGLVVADIRQHLLEYRQLRLLAWNRQPGLRHQDQ